MAYRIRPSEPFSREFCRIAENQLGRAILLLEEQAEGPHRAIHDTRKRFKRLRALYRLVEPDAKSFRRQENDRLRTAARSLSAARDATALIETVDYLVAAASSAEEIAALTFASNALIERRDGIVSAQTDLANRIAATIAACREAIDTLETLQLDDRPARVARRLAKVWGKQRRIATAALAACHEHPEADIFHELRKSAQIYWMHLSLLSDLWPSAMRAKQENAKELVGILGHEHDLSVLTHLINEQPELFGDGDTMARLLGAVISRQQQLRGDALALADRVLADDAEKESEIIGLLWHVAAKS